MTRPTDGGSPLVLPSREDPVVAAVSEVVGGPAGRRLRPGVSWWTPVRVLVVLVLVASGLGVVAKAHCRSSGWTGAGADQYTHLCYTDLAPLYFGRGIADGEVPYLADVPADEQVEYPVLTGAAMWLPGLLVPDGSSTSRVRWYFDVNVLLLAACAAVTVVATARTVRHRPWDAAMVALAPGLVLAGTINWDLWAVVLTALGVWAWARERPVAAGVLLGLGTAAKFYPLLLLGPLLVLCLRAGRLRTFGVTAGAFVAAWLVVNVPVMLANFDGWARFYRLSAERGEGYGSIWLVLDLAHHGVPERLLDRVSGLLFLACCVAVALLGLAARRRPRLASLAFLVLAAFLLVNKVYSPQYVVWLIPFAVLARPRWWDFLLWQAAEVVHFVGTWLYLVGTVPGAEDRALSAPAYDWTVLIHMAGTVWLMAVVVRDVLVPGHDPVRSGGADDPGGGVLDGAPDRVALRSAAPVPIP